MYVYLLYSEIYNRTYIGFTTNIAKRIRQHNGFIKGGAKATQKYRPWYVVLFISGFENKHDCLSFEYIWKHKAIGLTGRIKYLDKKLSEEQCNNLEINWNENYVFLSEICDCLDMNLDKYTNIMC